jgi:hypothetical protein
MSSLFDTLVHRRRNATPWAKMGAAHFLTDAAYAGAPLKTGEQAQAASVSVVFRPDVASRMWWTVSWVGEDRERREASAQELDLALWRAAEMELAARERAKEKEKEGPQP